MLNFFAPLSLVLLCDNFHILGASEFVDPLLLSLHLVATCTGTVIVNFRIVTLACAAIFV